MNHSIETVAIFVLLAAIFAAPHASERQALFWVRVFILIAIAFFVGDIVWRFIK